MSKLNMTQLENTVKLHLQACKVTPNMTFVEEKQAEGWDDERIAVAMGINRDGTC